MALPWAHVASRRNLPSSTDHALSCNGPRRPSFRFGDPCFHASTNFTVGSFSTRSATHDFAWLCERTNS
eukprot:14767788-Heterocapsa_arctica.AAC.1